MDKGMTYRVIHQSLRRLSDPVLKDDEKEFWIQYLGVYRLSREGINKNIGDLLNQLNEEKPLLGEIIVSRFFSNNSILKTAFDLNLSRDQVNRKQREGILFLARVLILKIENKKTGSKKIRYQSSKVVGLVNHQKILIKYLSSKDLYWIIFIVGIGGIGKSTLVYYSLHRLMNASVFYGIIWIEFQELFLKNKDQLFDSLIKKIAASLEVEPGEVYPLLKQYPHLIVVDGIQQFVDIQEFVYGMSEYSNPSKFVITSRQRPVNTYAVTKLEISDFDESTSMKMIKTYSDATGLPELNSKIGIFQDSIHGIIGGHPLALRTFVGLLEVFPAKVILDDFHLAEIDEIKNLYQMVFMNTWKALSPDSKKLLHAFRLTKPNSGGELVRLEEITKLPRKILLNNLKHLFIRSLVERNGIMYDVRYDVNSLTRSFLNSKLINE